MNDLESVCVGDELPGVCHNVHIRCLGNVLLRGLDISRGLDRGVQICILRGSDILRCSDMFQGVPFITAE